MVLWKPVLFPNLVQLFPKLTYFGVSFDHYIPTMDFDWLKLPSKIKTLKIGCRAQEKSFLEACYLNPTIFPRLHTLHFSLSREAVDYFELPSQTAPNLTSLSYASEFMDVLRLPLNLTYLRVQVSRFGWGLPRGKDQVSTSIASKFTLPISSATEQSEDSYSPTSSSASSLWWPPGLTYLSLLTWEQEVPDWLPTVPPTLRHLETYGFGSNGYAASEIDWNGLPRGLESLVIYAELINAQDVSQLPRGIKELRIIDGSSFLEMVTQPPVESCVIKLIESLPPYLTILEGFQGPLTAKQALHLPRSLTRLEPVVELSPLLLSSLPPSLNQITVNCSKSNFSTQLSASLPLDLPLVRSVRNLGLAWPNDRLLRNLPSQLTQLTLTSSLEHAQPGWMVHLPRGLESLTFLRDSGIQSCAEYASLPPNLTSFQVTHDQPLAATDSSSSSFPRSLTDLRITNVYIQSLDWFLGLPAKLQRLKFSGCTQTSIVSTPDHFALARLSTSKIIQDLQCTPMPLKICFSNISVTLPLLHSLEFATPIQAHVDVTDMLSNLPKQLGALRIVAPSITAGQLVPEDIYSLPRGLYRMHLSYPMSLLIVDEKRCPKYLTDIRCGSSY